MEVSGQLAMFQEKRNRYIVWRGNLGVDYRVKE
jgi:hypothetical protein